MDPSGERSPGGFFFWDDALSLSLLYVVILGPDPRIGCGSGSAAPLTKCGARPGPRVEPEGDDVVVTNKFALQTSL